MARPNQVPTEFTAIDKMTRPIRKMEKSVRGFGHAAEVWADRTDRRMNGLLRSVNNLTGGFGLLLGSALALNAGQMVINTMADFETGLVAVGKTADLSGEKLAALGQDTIALSRRMNAVVGTDKLLELATVAGQLGVKGSENILKFSETMAKLESATNVVGEEGAASIARIINITGEGIGTVDRFGSTLVALGNNAAATEAEILDVANEVARSTAPFGLSSAAVLGISTSLKSLGVQAQAGGSAVGRLFKEMEAAVVTGKNLEAFSKITGLTGDQIRKQFKEDAAQLFVPFIKGLQGVSDSGGSVALALQSVGINGEIAFKGLAPLAKAGKLVEKTMGLANTEFERNEALQKEFEAASKTLRAAMVSVVNEFKNIINTAAEATGSFAILRDVFVFVRENLAGILLVSGALIASFVVLKAVTLAVRTAYTVYSIALGINNFLQRKSLFFNRANTVALKAHTIALRVAAIAQRAFNFVLRANPIGLIITAIILLIVLVTQITRKWDEWGAAVALALGPLGVLLSIIQSIRRNWDLITKAFETGGIINGIKAIGFAIVDGILQPISQVIKLIERFTGADLAIGAEIEGFRTLLSAALQQTAGVTPTGEIRTNTVNPDAAREQLNVDRSETITRQELAINIKDPGGLATVDARETSPNIDVELQRGFQFPGE